MGMTPAYYLADIQTGVFYGETLPLENVSLSSSIDPGQFSASLDMRRLGSVGEGYRIRDLLANGKCTLVPILEGTSRGADLPPTSTALGEWWISVDDDSPPSPILKVSGPEFAGYAQEVLVTETWLYKSADPVVQLRRMLEELYTTSQTIDVNLGSWTSDTAARIAVEVRTSTTDYMSAIRGIQDAEDGPFEWMIEASLELEGWSPRRVIRTLKVGQPRLAVPYPSITLELAGPGRPEASLSGFSRSRSEHNSATTVYGWGAGSGDDQIGGGGVFTSRAREPGEPVKTRQVSDSTAMTVGELKRRTRAELRNSTPQEQAFTASFPTGWHVPGPGRVYSWRTDDQWTRPAESGTRRCVGWSWQSGGEDAYQLDLTEV